jgi:hypothetical protein
MVDRTRGSAPCRSPVFHCRSPANSVGDVTRQFKRITLPSSDRQRIGLASMPIGLARAIALLRRPRRAQQAPRSAYRGMGGIAPQPPQNRRTLTLLGFRNRRKPPQNRRSQPPHVQFQWLMDNRRKPPQSHSAASTDDPAAVRTIRRPGSLLRPYSCIVI